MKIKIKQIFRYQVSATKVRELQPGVYSVPGDISKDVAQKALKFGKAEILAAEKKAPENKVVEVTEDKTGVEKAPVRRRGARARSGKLS